LADVLWLEDPAGIQLGMDAGLSKNRLRDLQRNLFRQSVLVDCKAEKILTASTYLILH